MPLPERPASWQFCPRCSREIPAFDAWSRCPECGGLLEARHQPPPERGVKLQELFAARWRTPEGLGGVVTDVTDGEILEAKALVDSSGVGCEPASAASLAGARKLVAEGVIRRGQRVVAILTGHILKDPGLLLSYHQEMEPAPPRANRPVEIEPTLAAVEEMLQRSEP